jgi:hypothetical protein
MKGPSTPKKRAGKTLRGGIPPPPKEAITPEQKAKQTVPRKTGLHVPPPPKAGPTAAQKKAQADAKQKAKQRSSSNSSARTASIASSKDSPSSPKSLVGKDPLENSPLPTRPEGHSRKSSTDAFNALLSMASEFKGGDKKLDELQLEVHHATYNVVRVNKYNQRRRFAMKFMLGGTPKIEFSAPSNGRTMSTIRAPSMPGTSGDAEKTYDLSAFARFIRSSADPNHLRMTFKEDKHPERLIVFRDGSERELFCYGASLLEKDIEMVYDCEEIMEDGSLKYEVQLINQAGVRKTRALVINDHLRHIVRHQGKDVKDGEVKDTFHVNQISIEPWSSDKKKATIWYAADDFRNSNMNVPIKEMKKGAANLKQMNVEFPSTAARERFLGHVLALQHHDKGPKIFEDLSVWVGTWNVGDKSPPKNNLDLTDWLGPAGMHDIYAIGFQENSKIGPWSKALSTFLSAEKRAHSKNSSRHMNAFRNLRDRSQSSDFNQLGDPLDRASLTGSRGIVDVRGRSGTGIGLRSTRSAQDSMKKARPVSTQHFGTRISDSSSKHSMSHSIDLQGFRKTSSSVASNGEDEDDFSYAADAGYDDTIDETAPFRLLSTTTLWDIHILIFVRSSLISRVQMVTTSTEATGLGHVMGNKGGAAVGLLLDGHFGTGLCFITSHLAARASRLGPRQANYEEICSGLNLSGHYGKNLEMLHKFEHVFWAGDLNYRIDKGNMGTPEEFASCVASAKAEKIHELFPFDQLRKEMEKNHVFVTFNEGPIKFKPTYRWEKGKDEYSNKKNQNPSYCDRVLWRTPSELHAPTQVSYDGIFSLKNSDHRAVASSFTVPLMQPFVNSEPVKTRAFEHSTRISFSQISYEPIDEYHVDINGKPRKTKEDKNRGSMKCGYDGYNSTAYVQVLSSFAQPMSSEAVDPQESRNSELKMRGFPAWTWEQENLSMITPVISDIRWLAFQQFVVVIHADDANHLVLGGSDTVLGYGEISLAQITLSQNRFQMRRDSVSTRRTSIDSFDQSSQGGRDHGRLNSTESIPLSNGASEQSQQSCVKGDVSNIPPVGREAVFHLDFRVPIIKRGRLVGFASGGITVEHLPSLLSPIDDTATYLKSRRLEQWISVMKRARDLHKGPQRTKRTFNIQQSRRTLCSLTRDAGMVSGRYMTMGQACGHATRIDPLIVEHDTFEKLKKMREERLANEQRERTAAKLKQDATLEMAAFDDDDDGGEDGDEDDAEDEGPNARKVKCTSCSIAFEVGQEYYLIDEGEHAGKPFCQKDYFKLFHVCPTCSEPIDPEDELAVVALGSSWHRDHFVCAHSGEDFDKCGGKFVAHDCDDGRGVLPYTEENYLALFVPRCFACGEHVTEGGQTINGRTWHHNCFNCTVCHKAFENDTFFEFENEPYCEEHFFQAQGMYCARCSEPIADFAVEALGQKWHTECFTCTECNCPLTSTDEDGKEIVEYFEAELQPYCKQHFTEKFCDQCLKCSKPIMGTAIEALGGKWHPECLTCGHCDRQIVEEGQYYNPDIVIHEGTSKDGDETKPYCELCYQEHICPRCVACNEPIEGMGIFALNKNWHVGCLKCAECACPLGNGTKFFTKDLLPYCHADFLRIFADRCAGCGEPIDPEEQSVNLTSIGKKYHCACLVCTHCEIPLFGKDAGSIHQHNGEPYCKDHFLELACEKCAMCNEPITGSKVKFLNKHYHRDCMRCFVCDKHLTTEVYGRGSAGLPCCHEHSQTLTMSLPPEAQKKLVDSELAEKLAKTKLAQSVDDETGIIAN